jgi:hypothetical protein
MHSRGLRRGIFIKLIFISHFGVHPLQDTSFGRRADWREGMSLWGVIYFSKNVSHVAVLFLVETVRKKLLAKKLMAQCCRGQTQKSRKKKDV